MVIVMDMATGKRENTSAMASSVGEFDAYLDEVMNAGWLPLNEARLETVTTRGAAPSAHLEPEEFLRNLYRSQE